MPTWKQSKAPDLVREQQARYKTGTFPKYKYKHKTLNQKNSLREPLTLISSIITTWKYFTFLTWSILWNHISMWLQG